MLSTCIERIPQYRSQQDFCVVERDGGFGKGVISYRQFNAGDLIAELGGEIVYAITQHTLQIEPGIHLLDLEFAGYFLHSCSPNVFLAMQERRVYALKAIQEGDFLEMDYAQTEQVLFKQFACQCGAPNCRGWITGSAETADETSADYLSYLLMLASAA